MYTRRPQVRVFAGDYQDYLRFETVSYEPDEGGGRREIWNTALDNAGASEAPFYDEELFASMANKPTSGVKILCHFFPGLDSSWRIYSYADDKYYNVFSVVNVDNADREYEIVAFWRRGQWV
jgi:hypothetical protein